jgi:hypothetical protein
MVIWATNERTRCDALVRLTFGVQALASEMSETTVSAGAVGACTGVAQAVANKAVAKAPIASRRFVPV